MKLTVKERLLLLGMLPKESNFITLKIVRKLEGDLSFTEKEIKDYNFVTNDKQITWDIKKSQEKEIEIGEKATDIIIEVLKKANTEKKLTDNHIELYEKFIKE